MAKKLTEEKNLHLDTQQQLREERRNVQLVQEIVQNLQSQVQGWEQKLEEENERDTQKRQSEPQVEDLKKQLVQVTKTKEEVDKINQRLQIELNENKVKLGLDEKQIVELRKQNKQQESEIQGLQQNLEEETKTMIVSLQGKIKDIESINQQLQQEKQRELFQSETKKSQLEGELEKLKQLHILEREQLKEKFNSDLEKSKSLLGSENKQLVANNNQLQSESQEIKRVFEQATNALSDKDKQLKELRQNLNEIKVKLEMSDGMRLQFEQSKQKIKEELDQLRQLKQRQEEESQQEVNDLKRQFEHAQKSKEELEKLNQRLQQSSVEQGKFKVLIDDLQTQVKKSTSIDNVKKKQKLSISI